MELINLISVWSNLLDLFSTDENLYGFIYTDNAFQL